MTVRSLLRISGGLFVRTQFNGCWASPRPQNLYCWNLFKTKEINSKPFRFRMSSIEGNNENKKTADTESESSDQVVKQKSDTEEEEKETKPMVDPADFGQVSIAEVKIELNDDLKYKLVQDLSSICSIDETAGRQMLEAYKWNMQVYVIYYAPNRTAIQRFDLVSLLLFVLIGRNFQRAIDSYFGASDSNDEDDVMIVEAESPEPKRAPEVVTLDDVTSPQTDSKKEKETEMLVNKH